MNESIKQWMVTNIELECMKKNGGQIVTEKYAYADNEQGTAKPCCWF